MRDFRSHITELDRRMRSRFAEPDYEARRIELEAKRSEAARLEEAQARERQREQSGIPRDFWPHLDRPRSTPALAFVREWLAGSEPFGFVAGDVGLGKSTALCWAIDQGYGRWAEAISLVRVDLYGDAWDQLVGVHTLAIDDLGAEPLDQGGWGEAKFCGLLNARMNGGRRTLLATNLGAAEFWARYPDPRLRDRIRSRCAVAALAGPSMRRCL